MSTELNLLPIHNDIVGNSANSYDVLRCHFGGMLMELLADLPEQESVPQHFWHHLAAPEPDDVQHFADDRRDAFGDVLKMVPALVLRTRLKEVIDQVDTPVNRAVLAYLNQLPRETQIVLFWS